jgi:seryl-tRNA(Sec) selenium transferase
MGPLTYKPFNLQFSKQCETYSLTLATTLTNLRFSPKLAEQNCSKEINAAKSRLPLHTLHKAILALSDNASPKKIVFRRGPIMEEHPRETQNF